jgi:hypothetical protein
MPDLDKLARRLTDAQRRALMALSTRMEVPSCRDVSSNAFKSLHKAHSGTLCWAEWQLNTVCKNPPHRRAYRLSPRGLALKAHIERTTHD